MNSIFAGLTLATVTVHPGFTHTVITIHAITASLVVLIGPVNVLRKKKDSKHKALGRSWVVAMYATCVSGMFIYTISGGFTIFHALAILTFITTTLGVISIRRNWVTAHVGNMVGGYLGALIAGVFAAFVPGRFIPVLAVQNPVLLWSVIVVLVVLATAWVLYVLTLFKPRITRRRGLAT